MNVFCEISVGETMAGIMVINGGMLTTVQDEGRYGYQASGIGKMLDMGQGAEIF